MLGRWGAGEAGEAEEDKEIGRQRKNSPFLIRPSTFLIRPSPFPIPQ